MYAYGPTRGEDHVSPDDRIRDRDAMADMDLTKPADREELAARTKVERATALSLPIRTVHTVGHQFTEDAAVEG